MILGHLLFSAVSAALKAQDELGCEAERGPSGWRSTDYLIINIGYPPEEPPLERMPILACESGG